MAHTRVLSKRTSTSSRIACALDNPHSLSGEALDELLNDKPQIEEFINDCERRCNDKLGDNYSRNFATYLRACELGNKTLQRATVARDFATKRLVQHEQLKETEFPLENLNKVFCSAWLNDSQILFGTKCNKLIVLDINTKKLVQIPSLKSKNPPIITKNQCGIHALQINPSRTLVATGGENSNEVAVYKLPTLDPLYVGEGAHCDWVFDITWLDDEFFVSGSRDTTVALWRVKDDRPSRALPKFAIMKPLNVKVCRSAEKVRALLFNYRYQELVALSLNAYIHVWDAQTFKQKFSRKLPKSLENVCIAQEVDQDLYAVGSRSHVNLLDSRTLQCSMKISSKHNACGIRSLSFLADLLTIGTGVGVVLFYDIRACKYLEKETHPLGIKDTDVDKKKSFFYQTGHRQDKTAQLRTTRGFVSPEDQPHDFGFHLEYSPAIYTHCYNNSGTRLFLAGGPLPVNLQGNYAALWQ